ncbi:MAG: DUF4367 domain-containing protein [Clostridia bacterium]|jgi:uncharacterized short protein YbdD (DUF466 family)|nr:DUF4367 domain-containing protein [Clostridiaceae bacterium]
MKCMDIVRNTLDYVDHKMPKKMKKKYEDHVKKCDQCRYVSDLIRANYDSSLKAETIPDYKDTVMACVHISKEQRQISRPLVSWKRKAVLLTLLAILALGIHGSAKGVLQGIEILMGRIRPSAEYIPLLEKAAGESFESLFPTVDRSKYEKIDGLFAQVQDKVWKDLKRLKAGQYIETAYNEVQEGFFVKAAKLSTGQPVILYGLEDGAVTGLGEFKNTYNHDENTVNRVIAAGNFIAVPNYLPQGYQFSAISTYDGRVDTIFYKDDNGNILAIEQKSHADVSLDGKRADVSFVGGYEALWIEDQSEETRELLIYLGENVDKKVLRISANRLDRDEIIKVASGLEWHNLDSNVMTKENFFKEVKEPLVLDLYEEIAAKEKEGVRIYELDVVNTKFDSANIRFGRNDAGPGGWYMIDYRGLSYDQVKHRINYPMLADPTWQDQYELKYIHIAGRPYEEAKEVTFVFKQKDQVYTEFLITAKGLPKEYEKYTLWDLVLLTYMESPKAKIVYDQNNRPYIVRSKETDDIQVLLSVIELEDRYVMYEMMLASEYFKGSTIEDAVNRFEIIQ